MKPRYLNLLVLSVTVVLLAIVLEVGAHIYLRARQGYSGGPLLQYEFDPYKNVRPTPNYTDTRGLAHNAQGFRRSSAVTQNKPVGTFRIFLMGGSTAYGTGGLWPHIDPRYPVLKNSQTIDAYMEAELGRRFPGCRFEVINAAIPSIWTHHHLIYLNQTILNYEPDMVVLLDGFNDFYFYQRGHDQFASYAYQEHSHTIMGDPTIKALAYANVWWWGRKSAFVHVAMRKMREIGNLFNRPGQRKPVDVQAAVAGLGEVFPHNALAMIKRIASLLQQENVAALFVLQPMLILERGRPGMPEIEQKLLEFNVKSYLPNYEAFMKQAVPFVSEREGKSVEKYGAGFLDATGVFKAATGQVFTDYVHLTPEANRTLAGIIVDHAAPTVAARLASVASATN